MGYSRSMRIHVHLDDELVQRLDARVGSRGRSRFVERATRLALEDEERWALIEQGIGAIADTGHPWDENPAAWVDAERTADASRTG
jgi:predicted transcriptional regulator